MRVVFLSPRYPPEMRQFTRGLAEVGAGVLGVGDGSPEPELRRYLADYLEAVCNETLRLHPRLAFVPRLLRQPFELRGYRIPSGVNVAVGIGLVHHREDLYPEPARFRPERFLERKFSPFEFLPFGGGARRCPGAAFALYEMKIVLATVLREHCFTLLDTGPVRHVLRSASLGAETGIRMRLDGRRTRPRTRESSAQSVN